MTNLERCLGWLVDDLAQDNLDKQENGELMRMEHNIQVILNPFIESCCETGHETVTVRHAKLMNEYPRITQRILIYYYS